MKCPRCGLTFVPISKGDKAIERYYRARAAGGRLTIKQVAAQFGMSYTALKKHKQRYDARGKWGSKKSQNGTAPEEIPA